MFRKYVSKSRSIRSQDFYRIAVLKTVPKFEEKHLPWSHFCNKVTGLGFRTAAGDVL